MRRAKEGLSFYCFGSATSSDAHHGGIDRRRKDVQELSEAADGGAELRNQTELKHDEGEVAEDVVEGAVALGDHAKLNIALISNPKCKIIYIYSN